jgi:hypothetical protein
VAVALITTWFVISGPVLLAWIGILVLTEMELVGTAVAIAVALAPHNYLMSFLRDVGRRRTAHTLDRVHAGVAAIAAFCFSIWFFAGLTVFLVRFAHGQLIGVRPYSNGAGLFWQSLYYSGTTITTATSNMVPVGVFAQFATLTEVVLGLVFLVFIIAVLAGRHASRAE